MVNKKEIQKIQFGLGDHYIELGIVENMSNNNLDDELVIRDNFNNLKDNAQKELIVSNGKLDPIFYIIFKRSQEYKIISISGNAIPSNMEIFPAFIKDYISDVTKNNIADAIAIFFFSELSCIVQHSDENPFESEEKLKVKIEELRNTKTPKDCIAFQYETKTKASLQLFEIIKFDEGCVISNESLIPGNEIDKENSKGLFCNLIT